MKSLVEEASSVSKAIEKAWIRAGKPASFSVKVYEEAQSGFLGFNSKPAKIGLFFEDQAYSKNHLEGRKKHHSSSYHTEESDRPARHTHKQSEQNQESNQEKRAVNNPHRNPENASRGHDSARNHEGSRKQHDGQRSSSQRRRPHSFDKKEHDRSDRPARSEHKKTSPSSFEKREHNAAVSKNTPEESTVRSTTPVVPAPATPQPSARKVLKVSSRRYFAPKNDSGAQTSILSTDTTDSKN